MSEIPLTADVSSKPAPSFSYEIDVSRLDGSQVLPDHDIILLQDTGQLSSNPGMIEFELSLEKGMWWKGLILFVKDDSNYYQEVVAGCWDDLQNEKYSKRDAMIDFNLLATHYVTLSKAKVLGVHSNVYHIVDAATTLKPGHKYKIHWKQD